MSWENAWYALIWGTVTSALVFFAYFLGADKSVTHYYLRNVPGCGDMTGIVCVIAASPWHTDEVVLCDSDQAKVLEFLKQANSGIVGKTR